MKYQIIQSFDFSRWYLTLNVKEKSVIDARLDRISTESHWGFVNRFDGLIELKWVSGLRIYTALHENKLVILLCGGNKNGQQKDIKKAKKILHKYLQGIQSK